MRGTLARGAALLVATSLTGPVFGQSPDQPAPATTPPADPTMELALPELQRAKDLHHQGLALLDAGDVERALDYFERSRALYPSTPNVTNVAICLDRLGRYDEALEAYELLVTQHATGLSPQDRDAVAPAMRALRDKVASLWIRTDQRGSVIVDGRERGRLPLGAPIRVLGGEHLVRVQSPGFEPWEQRVVVAPGRVVDLDARLVPLANVGVLRVEPGMAGAVLIDGAEVGPAPWEGPLSPGKHVVSVVAGELGSGPRAVQIVQGQITLVRPELQALGPEIRVIAQPPTASIAIDGLAVGAGGWTGRLREGEHGVVVSERGYLTQRRSVRSQAGDAPIALVVRLEVDREDPRWPKPSPLGHVWLDAFGGYAGSHTMASGPERACPTSCRADPIVHGGMAAARIGYRFPVSISVELGAGYLWFGTSLTRLYRESFASGAVLVSYQIDDRPRVRGPFLAPGASFRYGLLDWLALEARAALGILFAAASDDFTAITATTGAVVDAQADHRDLQRTVTTFVMPSAGFDLTLGAVDLGVGLAVAFFPLAGPALDNGPLRADAPVDPEDVGAVGNAPASGALTGERAWGPMALWVPHLRAGYTF